MADQSPTPAGARRIRVGEKHPGIYYRIGRDSKRQYEITYRDESGTKRWQRVHGDLQAASDALLEVKTKLRGGISVKPAQKTLLEIHDEWAPIYLPRLKASTQITYERSLKNYVLPELGHLKIQKLDERKIAKWISDLQGRGLKAWTIRAAITPLRKMLIYAVREGLIPENPITRLGKDELPSDDAAERRVLTKTELASLFGGASDRFRLPLQVLAFSGLRASELLGLTWQDVDVKAGTIHVRKQLDISGQRVAPKTPKAIRKVFVMDSVMKALAAHKLATYYSGDSDFVFTNDDGGPMTYFALENGLRVASRNAGLRDQPDQTNVNLHGLRHGFASMLIAAGTDIVFASRQLGHANPAITMRIYAHVIGREEAAKKMTGQMEASFADALG